MLTNVQVRELRQKLATVNKPKVVDVGDDDLVSVLNNENNGGGKWEMGNKETLINNSYPQMRCLTGEQNHHP